MQTIGEYTILKKLGETRGSIVYRGTKEGSPSRETVTIKVLKTKDPAPSEITRFKLEYEIIRSLDIEGIVQTYDFLSHEGTYALVLEDFEGISLRKVIDSRKIKVPEFLDMAIALAGGLGNLHKNNIIHKDIKPSNILVNSSTGIIKITDFGISSLLTHENIEIYHPDVIQGTLTYMSPEQTGRMNREVDYRSDFYSLGITLYEMLTGFVPFKSVDPLEIIHCHIARHPVSPIDRDQALPLILSQIIMKLISKNAEERYQNSFGLMADLEECRNRQRETGSIEEFELGLRDIPIKFRKPGILVGREKEIDILLNAFQRVTGEGEDNRAEIMLVAGAPGIGKSSLVSEVDKLVVAERGYFITGKYDQFKWDVPYSAIIDVFKELVSRILTEKEEMIQTWKEQLLKAVGPNGKILTDVIPTIKLIIGPQPDVPELEPEQAFNRFNVVFKNCAHVVAQAEHPVVIFLDDLQWADPASLKLLKTIITDPGIQYLFLIGAYRDTEVDTNHILTRTLLEIEKEGVPVERIQLDSLNNDTVNRFIAAFFKSKENETRSLAELVHKKTGGNPFFINQFLKTLYEEGMLEPAPFAGGWKWDMQKIEQMRVTDNVVELMAAEITRLPEIAQKMLKTCSCMGNSFDLEVIPPMVNRSIDETFSELIKVAEDGYLIISGSTGRFQHDRILEAAYSLLSEQERVRKHYNIGNYLLENIAEDEPDEKIVRIVEQLNSAISLVRLKSEQFRLIDLNLVVGKKAKGSAAYESALHHLETGITLLETDCWEDNYTRALALYSEAAEAAYLCGEYEKMETLGETVLRHAMSVRDKIKVYETRIYTYVARKMHAEAIDTGLRVLRMMGERLPRNPTMFHVILGLLRIKFTLLGKTTDDLLRLPVTRDPAAQAKMRIISVITSPTYLSRFNLMPLLIFKTIRLSIRSGNSPWSPYAYAAYGMVLCGLNDFEPGYLFGNLGINLLEKIDARQQFVNTYVAVYCFIYHWKMHAKETLAPLLKGHLTGLETGNFEFAAYAIQVYCYTLLYMGRSLEFVDWEMKKGIRVLSSLKQEMQLNMTIVNHQLAHNLQGKANDPCDVGSENINGTSMQAYFTEVGDIHAEWMIYCYQAILGWLFDKYEYAVQNADRAMENAGTMGGSFIMPMFYLFSSLAYLSRSQEADAKERKRCLRMAKKGLKKLKRWAGVVPMNNLHKLKLVEAQFAAIAKENLRAIQLYEEAIAAAHENEYIHEEAVAWECASLFYRNRGVEHIAALYLKKAHDCYSRWGALAKVSHMEKLHPELISKKAGIGNWEESTATLATATESSSENLDLYTVIKASQAISGEINLRNLLERLLVIAVENAGARKGVLLLKNEENKKLYVEAWGDYNRGMSLFQSTPFEETNLVSPAIVNYVNQTGESVVLSDAGTSGMFINDPYVIDNSSRSIICSPILDKGQMMGILFLENNIAANVFSPERLELLQILSSQAAISIQNSRLLAERENAARLETEMKIAAHIQTALLPENPAITGFEISAFLKPADAVGGDYYDVINSDENNWVIIGDVSGHGVPAGLVMMMVQASIRSYLGRHPESKPSGLLRVVNKAISYNVRRMRQDKYMTITAISFDREGRALFSGLHLDLILYRAAHKSVELVNSEGIWLSPWENLPWKDADRELHMLPGDVLLLYTDGIIEARDEKNEMFSQERLMEVFKNFAESAPTEIKEAVLAALEGFSGDDDMTMVILKRLES